MFTLTHILKIWQEQHTQPTIITDTRYTVLLLILWLVEVYTTREKKTLMYLLKSA